jgi:drug/metabolite transporter (DMT)-like permease
MTSLLPIIAGILIQGGYTFGLFLWQERWKKSALALNAFKGCFATPFIGILVLATTRSYSKVYLPHTVGWMILASFIGIIVSDTWWLIALDRLGARRMTTIDLSKPLLAIGFGQLLLGDKLSPLGLCGVVVTMLGVGAVVLERSQSTDDESDNSKKLSDDQGEVELSTTTSPVQEHAEEGRSSSSNNNNNNNNSSGDQEQAQSSPATQLTQQPTATQPTSPVMRAPWCGVSSREAVGFMYAFANCVGDVFSATIVVAHHGDMSPIDVNLVKFGFAGVMLALIVAVTEGSSFHTLRQHFVGSPSSPSSSGEAAKREAAKEASSTKMDRRDWLGVSGGIMFVTVLTPIVTTWTYFKLPLATAVTIGSTAPIWSLPIAYFHGERVGTQAMVGAVLAALGVTMLVIGHQQSH